MALASHVPASWDMLLSTTMHNYRKELTNNIFNSRPLLNFLMSNGRVRTVNGGYSIIEPLLLGAGQADSYTQWQTLNVFAQAGISAAQYPWRQLFATIIISGLEEAQNNGKEQVISLIEAKVMQAEETLKDVLNKMIYKTRGANAKPGVDFDSFIDLIDATAAAGGITPAAAPAPENQWRSLTYDQTAGTGTGPTGAAIAAGAGGWPAAGNTTGNSLEQLLRKAYNVASDGGSDRPNAIFASNVYELYEASLTPQVRYTDTSKANLGFQNLMFKDVPIYYDPDCPAGMVLMLNSKYIGLTIHSDRNFKNSGFSSGLGGDADMTVNANTTGARPDGQAGNNGGAAAGMGLDARVAFITTFGNTTVRNRRRLAKLLNVT